MSTSSIRSQNPRYLGISGLRASTLFQLILDSYLKVHRLASELSRLAAEPAVSNSELENALKPLLGRGEAAVPWEFPPALLQFAEGCWRLVSYGGEFSGRALTLSESVEKTLFTTKKIEAKILLSQRNEYKELGEKIFHQVKSCGEKLVGMIPLFCRDEKVLYYLLRNRHRLNETLPFEHYEHGVASILLSHFSGKVQLFSDYIYARYHERGFRERLVLIQQDLQTFKAELECRDPAFCSQS